MKITAAVVSASDQPFTLEGLELDEPRDDEVLVRIIATGLCHTDLALRAVPVMPFPLVMGHEGAGIVERVGSQVTRVQPGDSVPEIFIPHLIELYRQGRFPLDQLVTFYTLDQINQAVEDTEHGHVVKAIVRMP